MKAKLLQLYTMYLGVALNFWYPLMTCRRCLYPQCCAFSVYNTPGQILTIGWCCWRQHQTFSHKPPAH